MTQLWRQKYEKHSNEVVYHDHRLYSCNRIKHEVREYRVGLHQSHINGFLGLLAASQGPRTIESL